jgi:hypothetical protein
VVGSGVADNFGSKQGLISLGMTRSGVVGETSQKGATKMWLITPLLFLTDCYFSIGANIRSGVNLDYNTKVEESSKRKLVERSQRLALVEKRSQIRRKF